MTTVTATAPQPAAAWTSMVRMGALCQMKNTIVMLKSLTMKHILGRPISPCENLQLALSLEAPAVLRLTMKKRKEEEKVARHSDKSTKWLTLRQPETVAHQESCQIAHGTVDPLQRMRRACLGAERYGGAQHARVY